MIISLIIMIICFLIEVNSKELPPGIETCHQSDPKINSCLNQAIQNSLKVLKFGLSTLNVPSIEPLKFDYVADEAASSNAINLKSAFKDAEMHGLSASKLLRTAVRFKNRFGIKSDTFTDRMDFIGHYTMIGQILVLPIRGEGFANVSLHKLTTRHELIGDYIKGDDGLTYLNITNYKVKFMPKWVTYRFDNLFNGDKVLGSTMNKFMNENWEPVFEGLIPGYESNFGEKFRNIANRLFGQVPFEFVFPK